VIGTLAQPAIAIAMPSATTHHLNPLITLFSPMRVHEFQRFPDTPSDGRSSPRDSALDARRPVHDRVSMLPNLVVILGGMLTKGVSSP